MKLCVIVYFWVGLCVLIDGVEFVEVEVVIIG